MQFDVHHTFLIFLLVIKRIFIINYILFVLDDLDQFNVVFICFDVFFSNLRSFFDIIREFFYFLFHKSCQK